MSKLEPIRFNCPSCGAEYKIVTIEAPSDAQYGKISCLRCDAVFPTGDGGVFFKYFLVGGHGRRKPR
jgi:predicted Zn finger-like uncharacterized protein